MSGTGVVELLCAAALYRLRHYLRCAARHLSLVRVPVFLVIAAFLLCGVPQIRELFSISVATVDAALYRPKSFINPGSVELLLIAASAALLAFSIWWSARSLLRFNLVRTDSNVWSEPNPIFQEWAPRVLGAAIPAFAAIGFFGANGSSGRFACSLAALLGGTIIFLGTWLRRLFMSSSARQESQHVERAWEDAPRARWALAVIAFAIINVLALKAPNIAAAAHFCGPLVSLMALAAIFVLAMTPLVFFAARKRVMIFTALLLWACGLQDLGVIDNHKASVLPGPGGSQRPAIETLESRLAQWPLNPQCKRAYFVSAEGGGIRAAAWTALVLARLERELGDEQFAECLVAASGVSGGSLGLAAFVAGREVLLTNAQSGDSYKSDQQPVACKDSPASVNRADALECRLVAMLTADFITPTLLTMFTTDQLQRLLPYVELPDRGRALESAFTTAFEQAFPSTVDRNTDNGPFGIAFAFSDLYRSSGRPHWTPILLLNTTEVHRGSRVIESGLPIAEDPYCNATEFPAAKNLDCWLRGAGKREATLIGAVHNSARFTYISPAGTVRPQHDALDPAVQLVDGGYFENSGTTTLRDLVRLYDTSPDRPRPMVIHISNDGARLAYDKPVARLPDTCPVAHSEAVQAATKASEQRDAGVFGEIIPPPFALYMTRESRGDYARSVLAREVGVANFAWLRLVEHDAGYPLPLGWRIGDCAICEMIAQLHIAENEDQLAKIRGNRADKPEPLKFVDSEHCQFTQTSALFH